MSDIVNLKQMRKLRARAEKEKAAEENRVRFGRSKAQKQAEKSLADKQARQHEGHKRVHPTRPLSLHSDPSIKDEPQD